MSTLWVMHPACIGSAFRISETLAALSSVSLNVLLVAVVLCCKSLDLKAYSLLILWNCAADTLLAIASYLAEFVSYSSSLLQQRVSKSPTPGVDRLGNGIGCSASFWNAHLTYSYQLFFWFAAGITNEI